MTAVQEVKAPALTRRSRAGRRWLRAGLSLLLAGAAAIALLYRTVPTGNAGDGPVDALVVLGTPAGEHGEINPMQHWRVDEAVREYRRGRAPRIVFAGGAAANQYVESDVMAGLAAEQGVPADAIFRERRSHTTVQNIAFATLLLRAHGWGSVEVISSAQHLPRASVLLAKTGLRWRVHAAPTPGWDRVQTTSALVEEAVGTAVLRLFGTRAEPLLHALAVAQHTLFWCVRWITYKVEGALGR